MKLIECTAVCINKVGDLLVVGDETVGSVGLTVNRRHLASLNEGHRLTRTNELTAPIYIPFTVSDPPFRPDIPCFFPSSYR